MAKVVCRTRMDDWANIINSRNVMKLFFGDGKATSVRSFTYRTLMPRKLHAPNKANPANEVKC